MDWITGWMSPTPAGGENMSEPSHTSGGQRSLQEVHKQKWADMQGPPRVAAPAFTGLFSSGPEDIGRALERGDVSKLALQRRNEIEHEYANFDAGDSRFAERSAPSGHHANAGDGNMELYSGPVTHRGENEQGGRPGAKKKNLPGLQPWEADSDGEHEFKTSPAAAEEGPTADWINDADEHADSQTQGSRPEKMAWRRIGDLEQEMPEQLKSHEEEVLGMRPPDTPKRISQAISNGPTRAKTKGEDGASDVDDEQGMRDVREVARRENQNLVELETTKKWQTSAAAVWIPGEEGTLVGDHHEALAFLDTNTVSDFDVEAEVMIEKGAYGGLLFRWSGKGIYSLCINLQKQQLEFRSPHQTQFLASRNFAKNDWYRLRVMAADHTLIFFLGNEMIEQQDGYRPHDHVYYCDTSEKACVLEVNEPGTYEAETYRIKFENDEEKNGVPASDLTPLPGCIGLFANQTRMRIRNVHMINLHEHVSSLRYQQQKMDEERHVLRVRDRDNKAALKRRSMAARLIQEVGKLKNGLLSQRMEMYHQAESQGREEQLRERKLLTWMTLLNVLAKINQDMSKPSKQDLRNKKILQELDEECPPPPPPPMRPPPSKEEEDLHERYEAMKAKYAPQWDRAGKKVLGWEKFEKVKNMQNEKDETTAFAFKHKKIMAQRCIDHAINAMSEKEHTEWLRKAWCFEHELAEADSESQKTEMEKWYNEKVEEKKRVKNQAPKAIGKNM